MIRKNTPSNATTGHTSYSCRKPFKLVYRFKVTLLEVQPMVWRRIEVPGCYSFWDLHVAITDAFGWMDHHLHEFQLNDPKTGRPLRLGLPDDDDFGLVDGRPAVKPDWKRKISSLFVADNRVATYLYDFGDGWEHRVELEATLPREPGVAIPRCLAGDRAGPPDDCGGPGGYMDLMKTIGNPRCKGHQQMVAWLRGMKGAGFDPQFFDPASVQFDDPDKRRQVALVGEALTPDMRGWSFFQNK